MAHSHTHTPLLPPSFTPPPLEPSHGARPTVPLSALTCTPSVATTPSRAGQFAGPTLQSLCLSDSILRAYAEKGVVSLFEWQSSALALEGVLEGTSNLVYTAATSAGKTLVAELVLVRRLLRSVGRRAKALFVVPLRALVEEKARHFEEVLRGTGLTVQRYTSGSGTLPMPHSLNVAVCTNEKAAMVVQSMASEGRLDEIAVVVFDEFHGVGADGGRGAALEMTIAKLLTHARRRHQADGCDGVGSQGSSLSDLSALSADRDDANEGAQIIGMTATLPNAGQFARWLAP